MLFGLLALCGCNSGLYLFAVRFILFCVWCQYYFAIGLLSLLKRLLSHSFFTPDVFPPAFPLCYYYYCSCYASCEPGCGVRCRGRGKPHHSHHVLSILLRYAALALHNIAQSLRLLCFYITYNSFNRCLHVIRFTISNSHCSLEIAFVIRVTHTMFLKTEMLFT